MGANLSRLCLLALAAASVLLPASAQTQKKTKKPKAPDPKVASYYGGVFLVGDGGIENGPCFRVNGRVTSGGFFNNLKSYESDDGTIFKSGITEVTQFPDKVLLSLTIRDQPCSFGLQPVGTGSYLTKEIMSSLKLTLYWKHGVDMRPVGKVAILHFSVDPIQPYATSLAAELPKRYSWSYDFGIPSASVPLCDSLVLIFRASDGHIAARVAA